MKIGILIPVTSAGRDWTHLLQTYLYNLTLRSFQQIYDKEHTYIFYIGIDRGDRVFDNIKIQQLLQTLVLPLEGCCMKFSYMDNINKGHLSVMWNKLFQQAYDEECDYFFQCGDDIIFKTRGLFNACIKKLEQHNNIGVTGPANNNNRILTQTFVSRKHMDIFGFFFPAEIYNWCVDDWINDVYKPDLFYPEITQYCSNEGGKPRYLINNDQAFNRNKWHQLRIQTAQLVEKYKKNIINYLSANQLSTNKPSIV